MHAGSSIPNDYGLGAGQISVVVCSETIQEFCGVRFYKCGFYFQRDGFRLNRVVWETCFGPIPDGFHVHHKDTDRANNQPDNLACMPGDDHLSHHGYERADESRAIIARIRALAAKWHGSAAGKLWHAEHYRLHCAEILHAKIDIECEYCGKPAVVGRNGKFCSNACKSAWRRDAGVDDEVRVCKVCKSDFIVNRYKKSLACSSKCGGIASARTRTGVPQRKRRGAG